MKKEISIISACLLFTLSILISCDNNDVPQLPESKEDTWFWGYFKGTIDEEEISFENEQFNRKVNSIPSAYYFFGDWEVLPDSINIMNTLICYNDSSELGITLYDLTPGERYLTLSGATYWYESYIKATIYVGPTRLKTDYIPNEENPFRVEITDVIWLSLAEPLIEVKLDGVLYNKDNPDDTLVINGAYGTR